MVIIVKEPKPKYSNKKLEKFYYIGKNYAKDSLKHLSCWEAVKIAVKNGHIKDERDPVDKFIDGFNEIKFKHSL